MAKCALFTDFNKNNIVFAYECQPVVVIDLPRCSDISDPRLYALLEGFKDGKLFNHKYRSKQLTFNPVHLLVFSNEMPNLKCLSNDRWRYLKVLGNARRGPFLPRGDMELVTYDPGWLVDGTGQGVDAYESQTSVPVAFLGIEEAILSEGPCLPFSTHGCGDCVVDGGASPQCVDSGLSNPDPPSGSSISIADLTTQSADRT